MTIYKGEQFTIPFNITNDGVAVTPEDVDAVRIKIGNKLCEWPNGDLEYDSENELWLYPMTENESFGFSSGLEKVQIAIKIGNDFLKTDVFKISIRDSIITERWSNASG